MRDIGLRPDMVLCSAAQRTRETLALAMEAWDASPPVTYSDDIYEAAADTLLVHLRGLPSKVGHALLVGHNPGLHELALLLLDYDVPGQYDRFAEKFPTGALLVLTCAIDTWRDLGRGCAGIEHYMVPRDLDA